MYPWVKSQFSFLCFVYWWIIKIDFIGMGNQMTAMRLQTGGAIRQLWPPFTADKKYIYIKSRPWHPVLFRYCFLESQGESINCPYEYQQNTKSATFCRDCSRPPSWDSCPGWWADHSSSRHTSLPWWRPPLPSCWLRQRTALCRWNASVPDSGSLHVLPVSSFLRFEAFRRRSFVLLLQLV